MAKIQKNSILQGIRGSLGDIVIREMRDGSIRVSVKPVKKQHSFNQEQKGCQDRMRLATGRLVLCHCEGVSPKQSPIKRDTSPYGGLRLNGDCFARCTRSQ